MGTDYHRATAESIPLTGETRPVIRHEAPHGHYSANTGEWDGQLPHAEVAALAEKQPNHEAPYWPGIIQRMEWARTIIRAHQLPPPQAAVLNEIVFRDGRGLGCTATIATIALDTGYADRAIRNAIKGLDEKGLILNQGAPGQKKILGLPVKDGQLPLPTSAPDAGVAANPGTRDRGLTENQATEPRHQMPGFNSTPAPDAGVGHNPGTRDRATPARGADITKSKQEREKQENVNLSLTSSSNSGSPEPDAGVAPHDNPQPRSEMPGSRPVSVAKSDLAHQSTTPEQDRIRDLVVQNWPLLEQGGWDFLDPAIRHYQTHGIIYLERDLRIKSDNLRKAELATRTCVHCGTVHETTDNVKACIRCEDSICVDERSSCRQHTCIRKQSGGSPDRGGGPADRLRR